MKVKVKKCRSSSNPLAYINANLNSIVANQNYLCWEIRCLIREIKRLEHTKR